MSGRGSVRLSKKERMRRRRRRVMINRLLFLFVLLCLVGAVVFGIVKLTGTLKGSGKNKSGDLPMQIAVSAKGVVSQTFTEPFDESMYSTDELRSSIDKEIEVYNDLAGQEGAVSLETFEVKDNTAFVKLKYAASDDYRAFNGTKLYVGKVSELVPLSVIIDKQLFAVKDGDDDLGPDDLKSVSSRKLLCLEEEAEITVPGNIIYFSSGVEVTGKKSARVHDIEGTAFVIYK